MKVTDEIFFINFQKIQIFEIYEELSVIKFLKICQAETDEQISQQWISQAIPNQMISISMISERDNPVYRCPEVKKFSAKNREELDL